MATDLVGNEKLQRFIQLLSDLNHETAEAFSTGKTELLHKMNDTILELYAIQQKGTEEENLQICDLVRSVSLTPEALAELLHQRTAEVPTKEDESHEV